VNDNQVTAIHEAGHAVVNVVLGLPFVHVTARTRGNVHFGPAMKLWSGPHLDLRYATSCMAGDAAVTLATGCRDRLAKTDHHNAVKALRDVVDEDQLNAAVERAYRFAQVLVRERWSDVAAIAERLRRRQELTYGEVLEVVGRQTRTERNSFGLVPPAPTHNRLTDPSNDC